MNNNPEPVEINAKLITTINWDELQQADWSTFGTDGPRCWRNKKHIRSG